MLQVRSRPFSFRSADELFARVDLGLQEFNIPPWHVTEVKLPEAPKEPQKLIFRDLRNCADYLMANPSFRGDMEFAHIEVLEEDMETRVYNEVWTGKWWKGLQVCVIHIEEGRDRMTWPFVPTDSLRLPFPILRSKSNV